MVQMQLHGPCCQLSKVILCRRWCLRRLVRAVELRHCEAFVAGERGLKGQNDVLADLIADVFSVVALREARKS